ncbi:MAG TPA: IclR family transcriptional regulator [Acidobacteriota bacterium]|jgi:DNA-binding IclR family transcriptional regulator
MSNLKTPSVPALERGLSVLELLAKSKTGLTLSVLTRKLQLPKSSTHCLLLTLERCGYLQRNDKTGRYLFGLKIFSLANMAVNGIQLREQAAPFLHALMQRTRLTVHMAILEQNEAVLIEKVEPPGLLKLATWLGKRMDVHCTGVGKALIAHIPDEELDLLIREHGLPRHNENTIASPKALKRDLAQIRKQGYSLDDEEDEIGLRCLGAPIFDHLGSAIAAISVSGTTTQITTENVPLLAGEIRKAASAISRVLGFHLK